MSRRPYREGTLAIRVETPGDITLQTSCHRFNNQGSSSKNGAPRPGVSFVVFEEEILDSDHERRSAVRRVLNQCSDCQRRKAKPAEQIIAELPKERVTPGDPPFTYVGVDCFGPLQVKQGRSLIHLSNHAHPSHRNLTLAECRFYDQCHKKIY